MICRMTGINCPYANENGYCDSTVCHNMNIVGNIIPKERPENISNSSVWVKPQSNWQTGTPTEEGDYLVAFHPWGRKENGICYIGLKWKGDRWYDPVTDYFSEPYLVAWQKITPYKEN